MASRTYVRDFAHKKSYSVSAATLTSADFDGTNAIDVFKLPEKSITTDVLVRTEVAGNTGLDLKASIGNTTVISVASVDTAGSISSSSAKIATDTGRTVSVTPSAVVTEGSFVIIVNYIEYTLGTGHLTNY